MITESTIERNLDVCGGMLQVSSMFRKSVFISHSSKNKEIAEQLCVFLTRLGVNENRVFCSSIIGQGINNGEKLNEAIAMALQKSKLLIYLLSHDFISSSYCMEELGVGWHLQQINNATCFYFVLPDIELSDLHGFVNSKIDKFSFLGREHQGDLGLFAENICSELHLKELRHSTQSNLENSFLSAIQSELDKLIDQKRERIEAEEERNSQIDNLRQEISERDQRIETQRSIIEDNSKRNEKEKLRNELMLIERRFVYLGWSGGIRKDIYNALSKGFWFDMVNRYIELQELLEIGASNSDMEMLLCTIYAADNQMGKAYAHLKKHVELSDSSIYMIHFENFLPFYSGSMQEIIEILENKTKKEKDGIVRDSYVETTEELRKREATISQ